MTTHLTLIGKTPAAYKDLVLREIEKITKEYIGSDKIKMALGVGSAIIRGKIIGVCGDMTIHFICVLTTSCAVNGWKNTNSGKVNTSEYLEAWKKVDLKAGRTGPGISLLSALSAVPEVVAAASQKLSTILDYTIGDYKKVPGELDCFLVNGGFNAICGSCGVDDRMRLATVYMKYVEIYTEVRSLVGDQSKKPTQAVINTRRDNLKKALLRPQPFPAEVIAIFDDMFLATRKIVLSNAAITASGKTMTTMSIDELMMFGYRKVQ